MKIAARTRIIAALIAFFGLAGGVTHAQTIPAEGSLIRAKGDVRVFVVTAARKRHMSNEAVLASYGLSMADVRDLDPEAVAAVPDARVIKTATSPMIFDITSGARRAVSSPDDFLARGYAWGEIVTVSQAEIESYPLPDMSAPAPLPPAALPPQPAPAPLPPPEDSPLLRKITLARGLLHEAEPLYPQETRIGEMRTLTSGMVNRDVELVQKTLQRLGFFPSTTAPNGVFGPATQRAVKAFQAAQGIQQVGNVGPQTFAALQKKGLGRPEAGSIVKAWSDAVPSTRQVLLAVWNESTDDVKLVHISLSGKQVTTHTPGFSVNYRSGNGVNVTYSVSSPSGYKVVANRFPIFDAAEGDLGHFPPSEEVYVPYSDSLRTPEIVAAGRAYLDSAVTKAMADLRQRGLRSSTGNGLLIADMFEPAELKNIAIIEHMDVAEFRNTTDKHGVVNRVFTILGTNKEDAFRFSGSSAGALGLAQFIESSYHAMRRSYPAAGLLPDFREGMADHVNAFKAMALHHDMSGQQLESVVKEKLTSDPALFPAVMAEVRAAAYNGGTTRVKSALKKFGPEWQTTVSRAYGIFGETKQYVEKFRSVRSVLMAL